MNDIVTLYITKVLIARYKNIELLTMKCGIFVI